jgi:hypothetical protein
LAIITRVMTRAATAVAARMVKNQKSRFPFNRKGLALRRAPSDVAPPVDRGRSESATRAAAEDFLRRTGEIQGKIV